MSEAMQRRTCQTPAWLLFSGVAIGVVGASVNKHAESVGELVVALRGRTENSDATVAVALGQWGLLLLVVGAVVVLAGLVMIALAGRHKQRRRAMDPDAAQLPVAAGRRLPPCAESRASGSAGPGRLDSGAPQRRAAGALRCVRRLFPRT
jgi:hypothetical protein